MRRIDIGQKRWAGVGVLLTALYLAFRLTGLDSIVTTDEPFWLGRSANFYSALWQNRPADTFQHAHPGVTTMWAGMTGYLVAAPDYIREYDTNLPAPYSIHERLREIGLYEMDVLNAARVSKIILQGLMFAVALFYMRRLFGAPVAVLSGTMIALDPFLIGHDRLLHVDGILAATSLAAILALADAVLNRHTERALPWVVAGALAALAWLSRSTGVILIGVLGIALFADALADRTSGSLARRLTRRARPLAYWLGAGLATSLLLWPALWAAPRDALSFIVEWAGGAASAGHEHPIYFLGEIREGDPGLLFYLVTIPWRLSVLASIGLLLFAVVAIGPWRRRIPARTYQAAGILLLFGVLFLAGMTMGAKKFDRYALPLHPILDIVAAIGVVSAARLVLTWRPATSRHALPVALTALLVSQMVATLAAGPYYLATYNPLLGGTTAAAGVMQLGWGEGVHEAATFIIDDSGVQPGSTAEHAPVVRISGGHAPLLYALPPPFVVESSSFSSEADWQSTRYYVATVQQWQRNISFDVIGYLATFEPAHTVVLNGVDYVRVWDIRDIPPPGWLLGGEACQWEFGSVLRLENIEHGNGEITMWFRTVRGSGVPDEVTVEVELVSRSDRAVPLDDAVLSGTLIPGRDRGRYTSVTLDNSMPAGTDLDAYLLRITLLDGISGDPLPTTGPTDTIEQSTALVRPDCGSDQP